MDIYDKYTAATRPASGPVCRIRYAPAKSVTAHATLPEPHATAQVRADDGALLILRRHGNPDGPRLVMSHGAGLSADAYYPFWSLLSARFDLVLYDFRNHGWNPVGDLQAHNIQTFLRDDACVARGIDFVPDTTHFMQLEQPEACVAVMLEFLDRQRLL